MPVTDTADGVGIAYDVHGSGPPLVLVHGITESRRAWDPLVAPLAAGHTVVAVDLRGHGESQSAAAYGIDLFAADVAHVVASLGLDAPIVVGHSLGGVVATAHAAAHPARAVVNVDQPLALAAFQEALRAIEPALRGDAATCAAAVDGLLESMAGPLPEGERARLRGLRRADQDVVLAVWAPVLEAPPEALDALVRAIAAQVRVPYLALHGIDPGPGYAEWLADVVPSATVEVWPDLGHHLHLADPEHFLARLEAFERSLP